MNKIWFLLILGICDLNNHIWSFNPEKLFLHKSWLRIMLWKWLRVRWKRRSEFLFLKQTKFDFYHAWKSILMQILSYNYAMEVGESLLEATVRVSFSKVIKKHWFLLIWETWDLNNHIWAFRPEKLFSRKSWLRIMLCKWWGIVGSVFQRSSFWNKQNLIFINFRDLGPK